MEDNIYEYEKLNDEIYVCVSKNHRFGTDALVLANFSNVKNKDVVVDLGTGCGIIPFVIKREFNPKKIYGVDIQEEAVLQFKNGVLKSNINNIIPIKSDLKDIKTLKSIILEDVDVVTCNPPYKLNDTGIKNIESAHTIARHEVLCNINDVCNTASSLLKFSGKLCLCQRPERLADVITAMKNANIEPKTLRFITKTSNSEPWLFLIEGKKGSKPFMKVLKNLVVYNDNGDEYSEEMKSIYHI